jgi:hypothetical protein
MLYLKPRTGEFRYDIPLQPGSYELRLFFAETVYRDDELMQNGGEASRLFNVLANGRLILQEFDVISDAGGPNIADIRVFRDIVPAADGYLHLEFKGSALLNGIEIAPGKSGRMLPVRIAAARQTGFTDSAGNYWQPDQFWQGGRSVLRSQPKADPDPEVYSGERFGHFSYAIPVDPRGSYTLTLRFAEFFWGPGGNSNAWPYHPGVHVAGIPGGAGSRTFDLLCNTRLLMKDFDIYREAGGRLIGITRTFRGLRPSVQGKLTLSFLPVNCYATVCAIEVLDEAN